MGSCALLFLFYRESSRPCYGQGVGSSLTERILLVVLIGAFSRVKVDERKARERELAKFDGRTSTSMKKKDEIMGRMLNPMRDKMDEGIRTGGE